MSDTPRPHRQPSPRRLFAIAIAAAVVSFVLTLSFGFADHAPSPHGVRIAVAAPAGFVQELTTGLAHAAPGGFTVVAAPSAPAVMGSVRSQSAAGGLVTGVTGPVTIVTAGAAGLSQQQAITAALTAAATALHRQARPLDLAPLPASDRAGLSVFVFELGMLVPSVIGSIGLFLLGRRFRLWWRVTAAVLFALLAACGSVLGLDAIFGGLPAGERRADRRRLPRRIHVRGIRHCLPGGHRAAGNRPGRARLRLHRECRVRRDCTVRIPARWLPPGSAMAAQRRDRVRRAGRGLSPAE